MTLPDISQLLSEYRKVQPNRATGGIYAIAGFDYQLRLYVAELTEALAKKPDDVRQAGQVFLEALSDHASQTDDQHLICIQAKRTLTKETLKSAAIDIDAIETFLAQHYPGIQSQVSFGVVAAFGDDPTLDWSHLSQKHATRRTIDRLLTEKRLEQPRLEPDPEWRAITTAWAHLDQPYEFIRYALDRALTRNTSPEDAQHIRNDICERFTALRGTGTTVGQMLSPEDFQTSPTTSNRLDIGQQITLARLRDQQYMPRPQPLANLLSCLAAQQEQSQHTFSPEAHVFWISGRSGAGKSVLLVQTIEQLVKDGHRVLWLSGASEHLEPALREIANAPEAQRPDFIAIDDLYDRDARTRIDIARLGTFIDESEHQHWPMILTCGPQEFADAFEEDSRYRGFRVHRETVQPVAADEASQLADWYHTRTGKKPVLGSAFQQTREADGGLFISLAMELVQGDLRNFAHRFAERVRVNQLEAALQLPLALNRLYMRAPFDWLTKDDREKLATLNAEGDFKLLEPGEAGEIVRLTHPHLGDALYLALRKPGNAMAYTNDLVNIFRRALEEQNHSIVSQLLRLFSSPREAMIAERLSIIDDVQLARECAQVWLSCQTQCRFDPDPAADIATSWACWACRSSEIRTQLGGHLLEDALAKTTGALKVWSGNWQRLEGCYPHHPSLIQWAKAHLGQEQYISHPTWSFVWEYCLQAESQQRVWSDLGLNWLQLHLRRPDWHFVWKKLLPSDENADWQTEPALLLGLRRLNAEQDGPAWAYVLQDLFRFTAARPDKFAELVSLAQAWLQDREERSEWPYIWQALLKHAATNPTHLSQTDLLNLGIDWLQGREARSEWPYIWQLLLAQATEYPTVLPPVDLLNQGIVWLQGREARSEWPYIWQLLLAQATEYPTVLPPADLLNLGITWLQGREDRTEWNFVWQALLKHTATCPAAISHTDLLNLGAAWLQDREERAEWAFIWQQLLDKATLYPDVLPQAELLNQGIAWLQGREERAEWAFIWKTLLNQAQTESALHIQEKLLTQGLVWLKGRDSRSEWNFIWQTLLEMADVFPNVIPRMTLFNQGIIWLKGQKDRPEWNFIWQALLKQAEKFPKDFSQTDLIHQGNNWLPGREDRCEWPHVWQAVFRHIHELPEHRLQETLLNQGLNWLPGHETQPDWAHLWQDLLRKAETFPTIIPQLDLLHQGTAWLCLNTHLAQPEASWCIEMMLDMQHQEPTFLAVASQWMLSEMEQQPWTVNAVKFIALVPRHPTSAILANELNQRISLSVNKSIWRKCEPLIAPLSHHQTALSAPIRQVINTLMSRHRAPVWTQAQTIMAEKQQVHGRVTVIKKAYARVELDLGLLAIWPKENEESRQTVGMRGSFYISEMLPEKGRLILSLSLPETIQAGTSTEGIVTGHPHFGLFVQIGSRQGLLHHSKSRNINQLKSNYPVGSKIQVEIVSINPKGLKLRPADPALQAIEAAMTLNIGDRFQGIITNRMDYGCFVNIGDFTGLLHRSKLPATTAAQTDFDEGQTVEVEIDDIRQDGKISLSLV
ncbi:S1 RNA-binding domain-containing protein [Photobacterium sp. R1]